MKNLIRDILAGDPRAIARAISSIENDGASRESLIDALYPHGGKALVWGITGPPGAGKSTLVDRFITHLRKSGFRIAVIAVDPSSPFSGGALLGDRLRMQNHALDQGVFIRSMASRGQLGGVAGATADTIKVFDAAGYDIIFIETIGVGQSEIEVVELADLVLLVLVPGMGDEIQALKAGIMEIGDLYIINKMDHEGAERLKTEVEYVLGLKDNSDPELKNPILLTNANSGTGTEAVIKAAQQYVAVLRQKGKFDQRRRERIKREIQHIAIAKIRARVRQHFNLESQFDNWVDRLHRKKTSPYRFINNKIEQLLKEFEQK